MFQTSIRLVSGHCLRINRCCSLLERKEIETLITNNYGIPKTSQIIYFQGEKINEAKFLKLRRNNIIHVIDLRLVSPCLTLKVITYGLSKKGLRKCGFKFYTINSHQIIKFALKIQSQTRIVECGRILNQKKTFQEQFVQNGTTISLIIKQNVNNLKKVDQKKHCTQNSWKKVFFQQLINNKINTQIKTNKSFEQKKLFENNSDKDAIKNIKAVQQEKIFQIKQQTNIFDLMHVNYNRVREKIFQNNLITVKNNNLQFYQNTTTKQDSKQNQSKCMKQLNNISSDGLNQNLKNLNESNFFLQQEKGENITFFSSEKEEIYQKNQFDKNIFSSFLNKCQNQAKNCKGTISLQVSNYEFQGMKQFSSTGLFPQNINKLQCTDQKENNINLTLLEIYTANQNQNTIKCQTTEKEEKILSKNEKTTTNTKEQAMKKQNLQRQKLKRRYTDVNYFIKNKITLRKGSKDQSPNLIENEGIMSNKLLQTKSVTASTIRKILQCPQSPLNIYKRQPSILLNCPIGNIERPHSIQSLKNFVVGKALLDDIYTQNLLSKEEPYIDPIKRSFQSILRSDSNKSPLLRWK